MYKVLLGRAPAPRGVVAGLLLSLAAGCGDEGPKPPPCELSGVPGACEGGDPATECLPGLPFCDAADATVIRRCAQDGRSSEAIGACDPGQVCGQPGCTPEAPCSEAPVCVARACDPGVLSCGESGEERVLACDRHGAGQAVLADCTALGRSLRCGPEPVCVDAGEDRPACDGDDACPEGERCTLPGLRGGGRYCVRTLGQGEPCPREDETICAAGLRCVVEHGPTPGPGEAVCRPTCDYRLNDCLAGDACLAVEGSRGVCSSTVTAPHREPCDTGLASPCQEGVVVVGRGRRDCLPLVRPEAAEVCDGRDDDCDGETDEGYDLAGDILHCGACGHACGPRMTCEAGRCTCPDGFRDADGALGNGCECPVTNDGVEVCDGRDNDCDGEADEGFDEDGDGFPIVDGCRPGYPADCDDADPERSPGTAERCNGVDDDCDGETDEEFDLAGDPSHCGECGRSCRVPGARLACIGGRCPWECTEEETGDPRCGLHCLPGAVDENGDPADGCEATPCTLQRLPEYEVEEPAPLPVAQPAFLAWRAFADGWLTTGLPEQGPGAVQPLAIRDGAAVLGTARGSGELADEPFPVAGVAVADGSPVLLDAAAWRLLVLDAEELAQTGEHLLPLPAGAGFMGLSWDGAGYWFGHAGTGAVLRMVPGDHAVQRFFALGPVRDLALDAAGGRVFLALPGRICVHTSGRGTCRACWAPPADGPEALGIAWDGDRLWVVDDSGGLYRVELP